MKAIARRRSKRRRKRKGRGRKEKEEEKHLLPIKKKTRIFFVAIFIYVEDHINILFFPAIKMEDVDSQE